MQDQLEQSRVELETFTILRKHEVDAIPKRLQVSFLNVHVRSYNKINLMS